MDLRKLGQYEFLDLSDIDENEVQQIKQTLFSEGNLDFLQLPWTNESTSDEWHKENYRSGSTTPLQNGPSDPGNSRQAQSETNMSGHEQEQNNIQMAQPCTVQHVAMYSPPAMPAYTMPPPSTGYQPQNVFVTNVTANVHGTMPGHYVHQHYPMPEQTEMSQGRGHRGRIRNRGNKRNECRMENTMVETASTQPYAPQYVPMYYPTAYYTQPMGSPIQHPNQQHAPASPLYIAPPMYTTMYGAYHPPGPPYYPPPTHVNNVMEDNQDIQSDHSLGHNNQDHTVYQHQISEEDYNEPQNDVSTLIVNSNIDSSNCEVKTNNSAFLNNNNVKVSEHVITDTQCNIKTVSISTSTKPVKASSVVNVKTETAPIKKCANVNVVENNEVAANISVDDVVKHIPVTVPEPVVIVPKVVSPQPAPQPAPVVETPPVHKTPPAESKNTKVVSPTSPEPVIVKDVPQETQVPPVTNKSWASLFSAKISTIPQDSMPNDSAKSQIKPAEEASKPEDDKTTGKSRVESNTAPKSSYTNDPVSHRMGEFLSKYNLDNRAVSLQPRGLTNRSNYCYINSILQALLACPPFYNLLKALPHQPRKGLQGKSPTPIIDSMVDFVNEFMPLPAGARLNRKEKGQRKDDNIDVSCGNSFEPSWIYKILNGIRSDTFIVEGRQEDAEEFFGCLLNGLNDEMLELMKLVDGGAQNNNKSLSNGDIISNGDTNDQDEDEWKVMGPKNKGSVTRRTEFDRSPISDIFRGQLRSRVHRTNSRSQDQVTDNVQPFFTLQLDIEKPSSVNEALEVLVHKDKLEGVTCSKTNQQVEAWQQVTVEELPLVMVLHLKCFNYKLDVCSKIIKALEFPIDLKIDSKLLSAKIKYTGKQKQYKLFAVVYHDGKEASKGHYLTDAFHVGYGGWVRYDDSAVKSVHETNVLHPSGSRVPYLLFYRRCDTIGNQTNIKKD